MSTITRSSTTIRREPLIADRPASLLRWGSVFGGAVVGAAFFALLTSLWLALANASDVRVFADYLSWWIGGSAIAAMFVGGMLAGWLTTVRGMVAGLFHGLTVWGLMLVVLVSVSLPALSAFDFTPARAAGSAATAPAALTHTTLWTFFWATLIGLGAAAVGGILGGLAGTRAAEVYDDEVAAPYVDEDVP
jgi:hypothetical protein